MQKKWHYNDHTGSNKSLKWFVKLANLALILSLLTNSMAIKTYAQTGGDTSVEISVSPEIGVSGTTFSFSALNFAPGEIVDTQVKWPESYDYTEADVLFKADNYGKATWTWDSSYVPVGDYTMNVFSRNNPFRAASLVFTVL